MPFPLSPRNESDQHRHLKSSPSRRGSQSQQVSSRTLIQKGRWACFLWCQLAVGSVTQIAHQACQSHPGRDGSDRAQYKMEFAELEIIKLEAKIRCDEGIGVLLKWKGDIQPDGATACFKSTSVCCFHDSRPTTGPNHMGCAAKAWRLVSLAILGREGVELPG